MKQNPLVPVLYCSSFATSLKFYVHDLGFSILYERTEAKFAFLTRDGAQLMIEELSADKQWLTGDLHHPFGRGINFQFITTQVADLYETLKKSGHEFFAAIEERQYRRRNDTVTCRQFVLQDPDGYLLRFSEILQSTPLQEKCRDLTSARHPILTLPPTQ